MIRINKLKKIYRTSRKTSCTAINELSLDFPDTGMVFVIGKSGSGKSTLLNMIGALDNITSGDVIVDGENISKFNQVELQEYRTSYLGFIFQDFLLLNELTVYENVGLALNISGIKDDNALDNVLERVGLEGLGEKYPIELSGGQKQRVAIARALIKKPKMLLCDEPTGNLDYKTSKQIMEILKEESKQKLVIVVSHNLEDAETYADRIVELFDGKIISDQTRKEEYINSFIIEGNTVTLPHHKDLNTKELEQLNEKVKNDTVVLKQNDSPFQDTVEVESNERTLNIKSSHLNIKNALTLSALFSKKNNHGTLYTVLITTLFICLFYLLQILIIFNGNTSLQKKLGDDSMSVIKLTETTVEGSLSTSKLQIITDEEYQKFYDEGYEGNIFKLYNYNVAIGSNVIKQGSINRITALMNYNDVMESFGTLCCDEAYLTKIYGVDGEIQVLQGSLEEADKKIIITDYLADCLINAKLQAYTDYESCYNYYKKKVAAIIYTGYKERYAKVYNDAEDAKNREMSNIEYYHAYSEDLLHEKFINEVYNYLGVCYTFSNDFVNDMYEDHDVDSKAALYLTNFYVSKDNNEYNYGETALSISKDEKLINNQVVMSYTMYNGLFGTFYTPYNINEFVPHTAKFIKYSSVHSGEIVNEYEVEIIQLSSSTTVSPEAHKQLYKFCYYTYGLHFDNKNDGNVVLGVINNNKNLYVNTVDTVAVPIINSLLNVFRGFCILILCLLFSFCFMHIVFYGTHAIKKNIYEIGVLKSLGTKNGDIAIIFLVKIAIIGLLISSISIFGIYLFANIGNELLIKAFERFLTVQLYEIEILLVHPQIATIDLVLVWILSIISAIIPLFYLRTIKPLNILKGNKK